MTDADDPLSWQALDRGLDQAGVYLPHRLSDPFGAGGRAGFDLPTKGERRAAKADKARRGMQVSNRSIRLLAMLAVSPKKSGRPARERKSQ